MPLQIDIGFGDAVTPGLRDEDYPALLDAPALRLKTYPRETVMAEKLEALVATGKCIGRIKDCYDLYCLLRLFGFEGPVPAEAIRATFERRGTAIPEEIPPALSNAFATDPEVQTR